MGQTGNRISALWFARVQISHIHVNRAMRYTQSHEHRQRRVENNLTNFVYKVHGRVESGMWLRWFRRNLLPSSLGLNHEDGEVAGFSKMLVLYLSTDTKSLSTLSQL
jgi:hypothetical protein